MTLGRLIFYLDKEELSSVPTRWLTVIFVAGDIISFLIQGAGKPLASCIYLSSSLKRPNTLSTRRRDPHPHYNRPLRPYHRPKRHHRRPSHPTDLLHRLRPRRHCLPLSHPPQSFLEIHLLMHRHRRLVPRHLGDHPASPLLRQRDDPGALGVPTCGVRKCRDHR